MSRLLLLLLCAPLAGATDLPVTMPERPGGKVAPFRAAGGPAWRLGKGATLEGSVTIPALDEREKKLPGAWYGLASVDLVGGAGPVELALVRGGSVVARAEGTPAGAARRYGAGWTASASGGRAGMAVDGDPKTAWRGKGESAWLRVDLGAVTALEGAVVLPLRKAGEGTLGAVRLEGSLDGERWAVLFAGAAPANLADPWAPVVLKSKAARVRHLRLTGAAAVAELVPWQPGATAWPLAEASGGRPDAGMGRVRLHLVVPAAAMTGDAALRVTAKGGPAVVADVRMCRLHPSPTTALQGKANGKLGPDRVGCGRGFDLLVEHRQAAATVLVVRDAKVGLQVGDVLVAVDGVPLAADDLAPGWRWFRRSTEATLGRALLSGRCVLTVLRAGKAVEVTLSADADWSGFPESERLYRDVLDSCLRRQKPNGSWGNNVIRTTLGALALLATRDRKHATRIRRAVRWMLARHPEPARYGNLGYWAAAYASTLFAEYRIASGDERIGSRIDVVMDWARAGRHTSKWGTPCLGHGPGGLPYGMKSLVAPSAHLLAAEAVHRRAGGRSQLWEAILPFMTSAWSDPKTGGHGGVGYNASYKDRSEFWSRSALFALACHLRGERTEIRDGVVAMMTRRHAWYRNSHAYGEPGGALGLTALAAMDRERHRAILRAHAWWFALAWEPGYGLRFTTPHMGAPYMGTDDLLAVSYALVLAAGRQTLVITGATDRKAWLKKGRPLRGKAHPMGGVLVRRDGAGRVSLIPVVPGLAIRMRADGKDPDAKSQAYRKPFKLAAGELRARVFGPDGREGPVVTRVFGAPKGKWKITGGARAARAIDDDPTTHWRVDGGQGAKGYPHTVVLDAGSAKAWKALVLHFPEEGASPAEMRVRVGTNKTRWKAVPVALGKYARRTVIPVGRKARYVELTFVKARKGGLAVGEIDLLPAGR